MKPSFGDVVVTLGDVGTWAWYNPLEAAQAYAKFAAGTYIAAVVGESPFEPKGLPETRVDRWEGEVERGAQAIADEGVAEAVAGVERLREARRGFR